MTTVCVTGASGFIASWLVKKLLERGYIVHATVRDPDNLNKVSHLLNLPFAEERLHLFKADLLDEGSFKEAVQGCSGVFHTASPFFITNITDPQAQLLDPAVKGTLNVLQTVKETVGVRRVVLTSSVAAIYYFADRDPKTVLDESFWSNEDFCRNKSFWYPLSKTLAEREAWNFSKEHGIDLVTINPAMVVGKLLQKSLNTSSESILKFINGTNNVYSNATIGWVHVEDVADAHIFAFEEKEAHGRYLCVQSWVHWKEITEILRKIVPRATITTDCADDKDLVEPPPINTQRTQNLGIKFRGLDAMLSDAVSSLKEKGFWRPVGEASL